MSDLTFDHNDTVYTPTELNREVRIHLEAGFSRISLEGEISNLAKPASGHLYFSLKDAAAQVRCAMFRTSAMRINIRPANGMLVLARGRISLYEPRGDYQFIIESLQDAGVGLLQQKFEELKQKLEAEGLFAAERKRALPRFPLKIGVISSPSGAVIRDILHVLKRRWPVAEVRLYPSPVQGAEAPAALIAAVQKANEEQWAEVLILARGGGSLEDLQAFNDESVARAVAGSGLPTISAVGHETDYSICDFVADVRAPTPSAAAEIATPDREQLIQELNRSKRLLSSRMQHRLQQKAQQLDHLSHRLAQQNPELKLNKQGKELASIHTRLLRAMFHSLLERKARLSNLQVRLDLRHPQQDIKDRLRSLQSLQLRTQRAFLQGLGQQRARLHDLARTLNAVSPLATLDRGYAVLIDQSKGQLISHANGMQAGQRIDAQLADGRLHCLVERVSNETLMPTAPAKKPLDG